MEKHINRLLATPRDWDFATISIENSEPLMLGPKTTIRTESGNKEILMISFETLHPAPANEKQQMEKFTVELFVNISKIYGLQFFVKQRIEKAKSDMKIIT